MAAYLIVFLGAGLGGALRHGVNLLAARLLGTGFPYGTLAVNVLGSFVMGVLVVLFARRGDPGQATRLLLTTGVLGGFTTFSTFSLDTAVLIEGGARGIALGYTLVSVLGSVGALFAGMALARGIG